MGFRPSSSQCTTDKLTALSHLSAKKQDLAAASQRILGGAFEDLLPFPRRRGTASTHDPAEPLLAPKAALQTPRNSFRRPPELPAQLHRPRQATRQKGSRHVRAFLFIRASVFPSSAMPASNTSMKTTPFCGSPAKATKPASSRWVIEPCKPSPTTLRQ